MPSASRHDHLVGAHGDPTWVHVATSEAVVKAGLVAMLESAQTPFAVTTAAPVLADRHFAEPDVVLFDVILMRDGDTIDLDLWLKDTATTVIAVDRTLRPDLAAQARTHGVEWSITLGISADELETVIREAAAGRLDESGIVEEWHPVDFVGQDDGLSRREADVLGLVVEGLTNHEIAERLYLSINSVKTYIRSAYRKIGATNRPQAVAWGIQQGGFQRGPSARLDNDAHSSDRPHRQRMS